MRKIIFASLFSLFFYSCGKDSDVTHVRFHKSFASATDTLKGGIMVYAVNDNSLGTRGSEFFDGESDETADSNLQAIPNGDWRFYAIGIKDDTDVTAGDKLNATDNFYCGVANGGNPVTLTGGTQTINITFSLSGCAGNDIFAPSDAINTGSNRINDVNIAVCSSDEFDAINESQSATGGAECDSDEVAGTILVYGFVQLPLLDYLTLDPNNVTVNVNELINSSIVGCVDLDTGSSPAVKATPDEIPLGNIDGGNFFLSPFAFAMSILTATDCSQISSATEVRTTVLPRGIVDGVETEDETSVIDDVQVYGNTTPANTITVYFNSGIPSGGL